MGHAPCPMFRRTDGREILRPRVSWSWMSPKRYARCTAAEVSGWSVSTLRLRSSGVSMLASTGATKRTPPDPTLGVGSARPLSELSKARHPSNGSEMLVSRSSAPNAGMRLSLYVVSLRNRSVQHAQLSDGIVRGRWRCEGCCCRHDGSVAGHPLPPRMSAAGTLCPCRAWNAACPFMKGTADQEEPTGRVLDFVCR
jgi:hypothetical protein